MRAGRPKGNKAEAKQARKPKKAHKMYQLARDHNRRAKRWGQPGRLSAEELHEIYTEQGKQCQKCESKYDLTFDHVIPYSEGGEHTRNNLQLLCRRCNSAKGSQIMDFRKGERGEVRLG